jgi:hypothetical protein
VILNDWPGMMPVSAKLTIDEYLRAKNGAYAQAQRDYFQDCIAKGGNISD